MVADANIIGFKAQLREKTGSESRTIKNAF